MRGLLLVIVGLAPAVGSAQEVGTFTWSERDPSPGGKSVGTYRVWENRTKREGRTLDLQVVVLHAKQENARPDPVFWLAGGPGQNAAGLSSGWEQSWMRDERDIVLVGQRGTGGNHRLDVELAGNDRDLQTYFDPLFEVERFKAGRDILAQKADLTQYSTPIAMDDLDEIRAALGYDKINLQGGSYGTRAGLVYLRRHSKNVRTALLNGVAPIPFKNPLYHAISAQQSLDLLFQEVEDTPAARERFPSLRDKFDEILQRLEVEPVSVPMTRSDGTDFEIELDRDAFCEALRVLMYYLPTNRQVPLLIQRAWEGDFEVFARRGLTSNRSLRRMLAFGMLMSVTTTEDVARITEEEIVRLTKDTFLGDLRVRSQREVAKIWPRSNLPENFGEPVMTDVPVLLLSGTLDPVTPPGFAQEVHQRLPNSVHVVVPGAHGVSGNAINRLVHEFLEEASVDHLDLSVTKDIRLPPLVLDGERP